MTLVQAPVILMTRLFRISSLLDGKGGGKKTRFQGKVNNLKSKTRKAVEEVLKESTTLSLSS